MDILVITKWRNIFNRFERVLRNIQKIVLLVKTLCLVNFIQIDFYIIDCYANLFQHIITRSYSAHCECFSKEIIGIVGISVR
jgi:hypothetical protein